MRSSILTFWIVASPSAFAADITLVGRTGDVLEIPVTQQCCIDNGGKLELAGPLDITYFGGLLWFTENQGYIKRAPGISPNSTSNADTLEHTAIGRLSLDGNYQR